MMLLFPIHPMLENLEKKEIKNNVLNNEPHHGFICRRQ